MSEATPDNQFRKPLIGIVAGVCLAVAAGTWLVAPEREAMRAAFLHVGVVMGALWLAMPARGENIVWAKAVPIIVGAVALVVVSRKAAIVVLPALVVAGVLMAFLRPRSKRRPGAGR